MYAFVSLCTAKKKCGFGASACRCWISVKYEMYASECVQREEHLCSALLPLIEAASIVSLSEFYPYSILIGRIVRIQARNRRCIIIHVWKWMCTEREKWHLWLWCLSSPAAAQITPAAPTGASNFDTPAQFVLVPLQVLALSPACHWSRQLKHSCTVAETWRDLIFRDQIT